VRTSATSQPSASQRVYYLRWRRAHLLFAGFCVLAAFLAFLSAIGPGKDIESRCWRILDILCLCGLAWPHYYKAQHGRFVTLPDGIEYYAPYYSIRTTWDNIESIGRTLGGMYGYWHFEVEGFLLHQSALQGNKWLNWPTRLVHLDRFVPVSPFAKQWRDSELGQDVRRYAPHLFA
jgi:hypothetical protein